MKLEGKVAVITGGAKGIGKGIVDVFQKYGAKIIILDYDEKVLDMCSENILSYNIDLRNKNDIEESLKDAYNHFGKINILVNNAGVCKLEDFESMSDETKNFHFDINVSGVWNTTQIALKYLKKEPNSTIVNMSSVTGPMVADPGEVAYATSKGAVLAFTKSLAAELAPINIRVNAIMPGYVRTPLVENMAVTTDENNPEGVIDGIALGVPLKRLGRPEEIGELAAFLASDESSYITGQGIVIDGGSTLPETMTMGI